MTVPSSAFTGRPSPSTIESGSEKNARYSSHGTSAISRGAGIAAAERTASRTQSVPAALRRLEGPSRGAYRTTGRAAYSGVVPPAGPGEVPAVALVPPAGSSLGGAAPAVEVLAGAAVGALVVVGAASGVAGGAP